MKKLKSDLEAAKTELATAEETFLLKGQVVFMKEFIRKIPTFDWDQLRPGNADFAKILRKEIEDEDADEARLAEEAKLASKAEKANHNEAAS